MTKPKSLSELERINTAANLSEKLRDTQLFLARASGATAQGKSERAAFTAHAQTLEKLLVALKVD